MYKISDVQAMVDIMGEQAEKFFVGSGGVDSSRRILSPGFCSGGTTWRSGRG